METFARNQVAAAHSGLNTNTDDNGTSGVSSTLPHLNGNKQHNELKHKEHSIRLEILQVELETAKLNREIAEINKQIAMKRLNRETEM